MYAFCIMALLGLAVLVVAKIGSHYLRQVSGARPFVLVALGGRAAWLTNLNLFSVWSIPARNSGCSRGRGGSTHLFDVSRRFYGGNAIVGGGLLLAVGIALADRMRGAERVTACFFGDGVVSEGEFHECMNLAALWELPVLFCCENNLYAMGTALERAQAQTDLALRAGT